MKLRGYGDAVNAVVATGFIRAVMGALEDDGRNGRKKVALSGKGGA